MSYKYVNFNADRKDREYSRFDWIMRYITFSSRWDLYPFRINKELDDTPERINQINQEKRYTKTRLNFLLISIFLTVGAFLIGDSDLSIRIFSWIAVFTVFIIPYQLFRLMLRPRLSVAFEKGELPYLWLSTIIHYIGSVFMFLSMIFPVLAIGQLTTADGDWMMKAFFWTPVYTSILFAFGALIHNLAESFYVESRKRVYVYETKDKISTRI